MIIDSNIEWNKKSYEDLIKYLISLGEIDYKIFNSKIISSKYEMLGIRIPILRKIAKQISKTNFKPLFSFFGNEYFEVVLLEGLLISYIDDYSDFKNMFLQYVLKVDNWAICDTVVSSFKIIKKNKNDSLLLVESLLKDKKEFSMRFGFVILLDYYVEKEFLDFIFGYIKTTSTDCYYVNMAISWLLCECYVKYTDETYNFIKKSNLSDFVFRKTVSKVNDSFRVSNTDKMKLRSLK